MKNVYLFSFLLLIITFSCIKPPEKIFINQDGYNNLIPKPVEVIQSNDKFTFHKRSRIYIEPEEPELKKIANYLAELLQTSTGYEFQTKKTSFFKKKCSIYLFIDNTDTILGKEEYVLNITEKRIQISASEYEGLFRGVQTLWQLIPNETEIDTIQNANWQIPAGYIKDFPRYEWRGAMLDVARHFFSIDDVKRYIDLLSRFKINRFHMHLSDDQGWRIEIKSWPKLTEIGSKSAVGGDPGGYYTQEQFKEIIEYAASRYITVIPEIDMPGHTNAALASYAELNCNDISRKPYTGMRVGFSSLCVDKEITYQFIDSVIREISAISPGKYIHIGGDEAHKTSKQDYEVFIEKVRDILLKYNKIMVGWEEISQAEIDTLSLAQHWHSDYAKHAAKKGIKIIMSPAEKAYLDMKYDSATSLGLDWAGTTTVKEAYQWNPAERLEGVTDDDIIGVEGPLWSETIRNIDELEYLAFPRIIGIAEIGWTNQDNRDWDEYKYRLMNQLERIQSLDVNHYEFSLPEDD
ncbi:beta-N-acetylhexosaminidase [Bacteroidota bacterium]